ncbi:murein L,D-transpeptidase catalytic domain family protein [Vibrio vulnificus]|nr:murein L,D-transpeptidase catalytic domain family protein [Vibrio vulnificus]
MTHNEKFESYKKISSIVGEETLHAALTRYKEISPPPKRMVVIDYTRPSEEERFFVINMVDRVVENKTLVSHAVNSGYRKPYSFSNQPNSNKSSVGLFYTNELYHGKNGLSLRIDGVDYGVNDNVRKRFIVIHGSDYAEREFIEQHGMLGRSEGCFAIPMSIHKQILPKIANRTPMYVHYKE